MSENAKRPRVKKTGATLKQIANRTGVSVSLVSRVLNFDGSLSVGDETRQKIIETAEALNYEPPRRRKKLSLEADQRKIALIHFLRPEQELSDPYYVALRIGIESRCVALGLEQIKIYSGAPMPDPDMLERVAGCIIIGRHTEAEIDDIRQKSKHIVIADYMPLEDDIDAVLCNLKAATHKLLKSIDGLGYQRIGFIGWQDRNRGNAPPSPEARFIAYSNWMESRDRFDPTLTALGANTEQSGHDLTLELLRAPRRPDVIVTANDNMAVGAYRAILESGLKIPEDIAIASFNDISAARFLNPPLTTVRLPAERIGENAVDLLIERLSGRKLAKQINLESKIIWRESCRKPTQAQP